jgi:hypothetical protein
LSINLQQSSVSEVAASHHQMQSTNNLFEDQMEEQRNNLNIEEPFKNLTQEQNNKQNYYPLTTGRKS